GFPNDGANPIAGLIQGSDGNFYGTTTLGGLFYQGTLFRITPAGAVTILHSFSGLLGDGSVPMGGVVQAADGNLYGTTARGGAHCLGTPFTIGPAGNVTMLHSFSGSAGEGADPLAGLVQASDGNFYGTTALGGAHHVGTLFKITPAGSLTTLYSLSGSPAEGASPFAAVVQGSRGE